MIFVVKQVIPTKYMNKAERLSMSEEVSQNKKQAHIVQKIFLNQVTGIHTDSRKVTKDSIFVSLKGQQTDGHLYLSSAIQKGASVLVVEDEKWLSSLSKNIFKGKTFVVPDTREILPDLLNEFYNYPSEKMFCVGVTGTNGKTTISHILSFIFSQCGWRSGLIGTIGNRLEDKEYKSTLTTPAPVELYFLLNDFYQQKSQAVVMEVSSIGLDQNRVGGVDFNLVVFTNLTEDHLDYHKNQEEYFLAKKKLFQVKSINKNHKLAVLNFDDLYGPQIARSMSPGTYISYGQTGARFQWKILSSDLTGSKFQLSYDQNTITGYLSMPGVYNVSNAVAALCCAYTAGFSLEKAVESLKKFPGVKGRLQRVHSEMGRDNQEGPLVFVDYAHTPQALEAVLSFLQKHKPRNSRLVTVFGCGGQRDQHKRPHMASIAEKFSDTVILTSDNPRKEDPDKIIQDCLKGVKQKQQFIVEPDRKQAIQKALNQATKNDIVLVAGKGHEEQQIIYNQKLTFSDSDVIKELMG